MMNKRFAIVGVILLGTIGLVDAQDRKSTSTGVFTEAQTKRGMAAYNANCASCHGSDLRSTDREFPSLTDGPFQSWVGKTIAEKFEVTRDTMPPKEGRSLDDQLYLDIVTYILRFNKIPAGNQELKPDLPTLREIVISAPPV